MSIYKRQMEKLGLNLEQYSKLVGMPIEMTKKIINGKEVVENMQVNNFLRNKENGGGEICVSPPPFL